ncbi:hypothetical protein IP88_06140 [alpha proteobacterium AAP81b]|nr:hypothetical protein IP88_06140 [alpha proteobacterium AAP81b]
MHLQPGCTIFVEGQDDRFDIDLSVPLEDDLPSGGRLGIVVIARNPAKALRHERIDDLGANGCCKVARRAGRQVEPTL